MSSYVGEFWRVLWGSGGAQWSASVQSDPLPQEFLPCIHRGGMLGEQRAPARPCSISDVAKQKEPEQWGSRSFPRGRKRPLVRLLYSWSSSGLPGPKRKNPCLGCSFRRKPRPSPLVLSLPTKPDLMQSPGSELLLQALFLAPSSFALITVQPGFLPDFLVHL